MPLVIVYPLSGRLGVVHPAADADIAEVAASVVPDGTPHRTIDADSLPEDSAYSAAWTANFDSEPCVVTVDPVKAQAIDAQLALAQAESWFAEQIAVGYATEDGWVMGLASSDVALLTGNYILAKEAAVLELPLPPIIDKDGVPHEFESIEAMTAVMLAYGQHRAQISAQYAAMKAAAAGQ